MNLRSTRLRLLCVALAVFTVAGSPGPAIAADGGYPELTPAQLVQLREAIAEQTRNPRGPYLRIRWFCEDGTVLPPDPYACRPHGGGAQHAQVRLEIAAFGELGFHFGTIYRALEPADVIDTEHAGYRARELVVQAYLERADDGWIMRRARFYRGARQAEDGRPRGWRFSAPLSPTETGSVNARCWRPGSSKRSRMPARAR